MGEIYWIYLLICLKLEQKFFCSKMEVSSLPRLPLDSIRGKLLGIIEGLLLNNHLFLDCLLLLYAFEGVLFVLHFLQDVLYFVWIAVGVILRNELLGTLIAGFRLSSFLGDRGVDEGDAFIYILFEGLFVFGAVILEGNIRGSTEARGAVRETVGVVHEEGIFLGYFTFFVFSRVLSGNGQCCFGVWWRFYKTCALWRSLFAIFWYLFY